MPEAEVSHEARIVVAFVRRLRRGDRVILKLRGESDQLLQGHCTEDGLLNVVTSDPERRLALRLRRVSRGPDLRLRMDVPLEAIEGSHSRLPPFLLAPLSLSPLVFCVVHGGRARVCTAPALVPVPVAGR
jgi:hypothetical protein